MARIRTVKPEFFTSESVCSVSPLARILFVGLWCESDREGRFKYKPKTLKIRYLPMDNCDIDELCAELMGEGMISAYTVDGIDYCEIPGFAQHQVINNREAQSTIPARVKGASLRVLGEGRKEGKGKEGRKEGQDDQEQADAFADDKSSASTVPNCPYDEIVDAYHERLPMLTGVRVMSDPRKRALKARWREDPERQNVEFWSRYFGYVATSDFLTGNPGPWSADFEWIIQAGNFIKIIEGKYHQELEHAGQ